MLTHTVHSRQLLRSSITQGTLCESGEFFLEFDLKGRTMVHQALSSADPEMGKKAEDADGRSVSGRLRIEFLTETSFRVRYNQANVITENVTPVVEAWPQLDHSIVVKECAEGISLSTSKCELIITLDPFMIEARDAAGERVWTAGGGERNYFKNWDALNLGISRTMENEPVATEAFELRHDEAIYGFGEQFLGVNKVGQTIELYMLDALGVTSPRSYKNVPFFVSTSGYGMYFNNTAPMSFWVGSRSATDIQVAVEDDYLDYTVFLGDIPSVLDQYTSLTGRGYMPPEWTFGYWQSKISYKAADETLEIGKKLREYDIPCSVIHLDTHWFKKDWYCDLEFDRERFPDPKAYMSELRKMGIRVSLWQLPYIPEGNDLYEAFKAVDGFVKTQSGDVYNGGVCFVADFKGTVGIIDFTNPKAVEVYQAALTRLFEQGASVIKTDFGEAAPEDGVYFDGTPGKRMHNLYPLLYNKAAFEVTRRVTGDGVVWARSAWAGNQRYPVSWGGDSTPNFANMVPQMAGGLSLGFSGFQFWSQDIGGFLSDTGGDLLIRWMQMSVFQSHIRIHGFGTRELYNFEDDRVMRICRDYLHLRERMMPYILQQAQKCVETSLPMTRALPIAYQDDPTTWNISDQWLFGDDILVAPVVSESSTRKVYLPEGKWKDWWTNEVYSGRQWLTVNVDIEHIPLYVKACAKIEMLP